MPNPYGYAAAIDNMGSISAPLLAATSAALLALVLSANDTIRWENLALLLLLGATLSFVAAVQLTFWAKRFVVTPGELETWWPERSEFMDREIEAEQRFHHRRHLVWAKRARWAYNSGVLCLLGALPIMLIPPECVYGTRLIPVAVATLGFVLEAAWIFATALGVFDRFGEDE